MILSRTALVLALALAGCGDRSQILFSIDTTAGVPCDIETLRITAKGSESSSMERELRNVRLPLTITLEDDTSNGGFDLTVSAYKGDTEVLRASGALQFAPSGGPLGGHLVLESSCTPQRPCQMPQLAPYVAPPAPVAARFVCGPNVRRYMPSTTSELFADACSIPGENAGKVLNDGKRGAAKLPLSATAIENFNFRFYGRPILQIWAHEDGYISFSPNNPDAVNDLDPGPFDRDILMTGVPPPSTSAMAFWDSLTLGVNGVCYALEGQPGTQKLRVTWKGTCHGTVCGADSLNFTAVLDERSNRIAFTYGAMMASNPDRAQGATATVGLVNNATSSVGGCAVAMCNQGTGLCSDGKTACGYTQMFSNMPQSGGVQNVQFDPIEDPAN